MRERNFVTFAVASALTLAACGTKPAEKPAEPTETATPRLAHLEVDVHACVSLPDDRCDPGDPNLGRVAAAIADENNEILVEGETDENGRVKLEGDFLEQDLKFLFEEPITVNMGNGTAVTLCANQKIYKDIEFPDGSHQLVADVLYGRCGPQPPQNQNQPAV